MAQRLRDFDLDEPIGIDTNLFIYHFADHPRLADDCSALLIGVANDQILAVTSNIIVGEVMHCIMMQRGADVLDTENWEHVRRELRANASFAKSCWHAANRSAGLL